MGDQTTIYRYGPVAWLWRAFIALALLIGAPGLVLGASLEQPVLVFIAAILLGPALFFGAVLAVRVDRLPDGRVRIWTLIFWRRDVSRQQLGTPRLRTVAQGRSGPMHSPRLWVPVHGSVPIYLDLQGEIVDRGAFVAFFSVPRAGLQ